MYPLTFGEYVDGSGLSPAEAWKNYLVYGGIPLVYQQANDENRTAYLTELCNEVYLKDIVGRKNIRHPDVLADLFSVAASDIGTALSPSSLERTFRSLKKISVSDDTIDHYISCFEDIGVRNARLQFHQIEEPHLMENIIYNELRYRGFLVDVGEVDINERTDRIDKNGNKIYKKKSLEVDFIATKGNKKYYLQSCMNITDPETLTREKRSLFYIDDSFKKIIVTKDGLGIRIDENGYQIMDLFDFLLHEELM